MSRIDVGNSNNILSLPLNYAQSTNPINGDNILQFAVNDLLTAKSAAEQGVALRHLDSISGGRKETQAFFDLFVLFKAGGRLTDGLHPTIADRVAALEAKGEDVAIERNYDKHTIELRYAFVKNAPINGHPTQKHTRTETYNMETGRQLAVSQNLKVAKAKEQAQSTQRFPSNKGLDIPSSVVSQANVLYDYVKVQAGHEIYVTSGRRGPFRQAEAMHNNWADGTPPSYKNKTALAEVKAQYDLTKENGWNRKQTINAMADALQKQVDQGIYLSRHLRSKAIDIRTPSSVVVEAIKSHPSVHSVARENDHIHIEFK